MDFVDLVDVYDAHFRATLIEIRGLEQFQDDIFHVVADVTRFRQCRRIDDRKGYVEQTRKRLGQEGLAAARWANQEDVGFLEFDAVDFTAGSDAFVVVVNGDGQNAFGPLLTDGVLIQKVFDFGGFRDSETLGNPFSGTIFGDNLATKADAFVTDVDVWPGDQFADFIVPLAAEGTSMYITSGAMWGHWKPPL
jgi:hypothetical protein